MDYPYGRGRDTGGYRMSNKALIKKTEAHREAYERLRDRILDATDDRGIIALTDRIELLLEELVEALVEDEGGADGDDDHDEDDG